MVTIVEEPHKLQELATYLVERVPFSLHVYGQILNKTLGLLDCKVIVNRWPSPSVVVVHIDKRKGFEIPRYALYTINTKDYEDFILFGNVLDWTKPFFFTAIEQPLEKMFEAAARKHAGSLTTEETSRLLYKDVTNLPTANIGILPHDFEFTTLKETDAIIIGNVWKYRRADIEDRIKFLITTFPSIGVRNSTSKRLVGWIVTNYDRSGAMGYVVDEYRNLGILKAMSVALQRKNIHQGLMRFSYGFIAVHNDASMAAVGALNNRQVATPFKWLMFEPNNTHTVSLL